MKIARQLCPADASQSHCHRNGRPLGHPMERTKLIATTCTLLVASLLELTVRPSEAALLHAGRSVPFKTSFVSSSDNMSLRRVIPAVASIRELLAGAGEDPASVAESLLLQDGDSSQLVESLVAGGQQMVSNLEHHHHHQASSDHQRDSATSNLVASGGGGGESSPAAQSDDLMAISTSNQHQVVAANNNETTTGSTPAPTTTTSASATTTSAPSSRAGEPNTTTTASVTTTTTRQPTTTTPAPTTTTTVSTSTTTAAPGATSSAPASTSSQPITIDVTGEQLQLQVATASVQSNQSAIVIESRPPVGAEIAAGATTTTTTAAVDTKAPATTRAPATTTQQPSRSGQSERESRTVAVAQDERLQPQHGAYGGRVVASSSLSSSSFSSSSPTGTVANASRGFFVATAPAIERWPARLANSSAANSTEGAEPVRVVNEFVFVPEDSLGPLELDQSEFVNTTLSNSNDTSRTLPAEHRTLDEADPMEAPASSASAGNSSLMLVNDNGEVEVDYINLDSGDLEEPHLGAAGVNQRPAPDLQDRTVPTGGLSFTSSGRPTSSSPITTTTTSTPPLPTSATSPSTTTTTASTTTTTTPKPTSVKIHANVSTSATNTTKQPQEQRAMQSITISELRSERNKMAATTTTTSTTSTTKRPTERQRVIAPQVGPVADDSLRVAGDQQRRQASERKNNKFLLEPEGDKRRPTTTTREPARQVSRAASGRRLSSAASSQQQQQQHRQVFSEPSRRDWHTRRRRPADTFSPVNNGADEEEASILTRYSMSSPLSRLSSLGRASETNRSPTLAVAAPVRSQRREPALRVAPITTTTTTSTTTSRPATFAMTSQTSSPVRSDVIQVNERGREQVAADERNLVTRVLDEEDKEGERQQQQQQRPRLTMTLIASSKSGTSDKVANETVSPQVAATPTTTTTTTNTTLKPTTPTQQPLVSTTTTGSSMATASTVASQARQQTTAPVASEKVRTSTSDDDEETLVALLIKDEQDRQVGRPTGAQRALTQAPNTAASNSYGGNNNNKRQQPVATTPDYGDTGKWQPDTNVDYSLIQDYDYRQQVAAGSGGSATNNLPGRPGVDYPVHWQVPKTSFDCRNYELTGFYADVESDCQAYHSCHRGRGGRHTFLCPNGTLFSQELLTCDWWYNVECSQSKLYMPSAPAAAALSLGGFGDLHDHEPSPTGGGRPQAQPANPIKRSN